MPFNKDQLRHKGKFAKKKVLDKRKQAIVAMHNAKKL